jgi:hypothetical protein
MPTIMESAPALWQRMDGLRSNMLQRIERFAALTIPKVCRPDGETEEVTIQSNDVQSMGAQAVNHLNNKLMMAMFAPTRPFFRVSMSPSAIQELEAQNGVKSKDLQPIFAKIERDAMSELDVRAQRPKLYSIGRHLIIAGQCLLDLSNKAAMRVMGLKYWCIKRTADGRMHTLVIREKVAFDELDTKVQEVVGIQRIQPDAMVEHFKVLRLQSSGDITMTQWVDNIQLPAEFNGKWPADECPYKVIHWDLADESNYATGLVEEHAGSFEMLSALSNGVLDGAILGMEFRWMVNPTGMTDAESLNRSKNGDALPGLASDVAPVAGGNPQSVQSALAALAVAERRIAVPFLLNSAVTRDAERVTAEEIRMQAVELETALGGVYTTLSANLQGHVANWLLDSVGTSLKGTKLKITVVTGLDALSRNGDLQAFKLALNDLAAFENLPEPLRAWFNFPDVVNYVGQGYGIDLTPLMLTQEQYQAQAQQQAGSRVAEAGAQAGAIAEGEASAQPPQQQGNV